jgi:hypothetical protein
LLTRTTHVLRLLSPILAFLAWAPAAHAWTWPVQGPVLQAFAYDQAHPYAAGQHRGIDIGAHAAGDTVVAPAAGMVGFAGSVPTSGETVSIETADGYSVTLTNLGSILVSKGATVSEGEAVGTVGPSGTPEVSGPYVHLGIRVADDPNGYLDPLGFLPPPAQSAAPASAPAAPQPSAGGASAGTTASEPAAATAPAPAPDTPSASTRGTTVQPSPVRAASRPGRASTPRTDAERSPSAQRPAASPHAAKPRHSAIRPTRSLQRPAVEAAASHEPAGLDAGQEPRLGFLGGAQVGGPRAAPSASWPALVCNGVAALVALAAALATARRRRREPPSAGTEGAEVLDLPQPTVQRRAA